MLLTTAYSSHLKGAMTQTECDAIKYSVEYGADLKASIDVYRGSRIGNATALDIVKKLLPKEQYYVAVKE
jgi:hypothetical protein